MMKLGTRVAVVKAADDTCEKSHIGKTGSVVAIANTDSCSCGSALTHPGRVHKVDLQVLLECPNPHIGESNADPIYSVRGDDGFLDWFWPEEIGKLDDMGAFP